MKKFSLALFFAASVGLASAAISPVSSAEFVEKAARSGNAEVRMGRLALENSTDPEVQALGQMLIDDHAKSRAELEKLASSKGLSMPQDTALIHTAQVVALGMLEGEAFDEMFLTFAEMNHEKSIEMFRAQATDGEDAEIKAFASRTAPKLEDHMAVAEMLDREQD